MLRRTPNIDLPRFRSPVPPPRALRSILGRFLPAGGAAVVDGASAEASCMVASVSTDEPAA